MSGKIDFIQTYIDKCSNVQTNSEAKELLNEILRIFENEINGLANGLDSNDPGKTLEFVMNGIPQNYDYLSDIKLTKQRLCLYKANLEERETKSHLTSKSITINNTNTNTNTNTNINNVSINLENTLSAIEELQELDDDQKAMITGYLTSLDRTRNDKAKFWETSKKILAWLGDKSIEVGIAILPYLGQIKQLTGT